MKLIIAIATLGQIISQGVQLKLMWELMNNITNGAWLLEQVRKFGFQFDKTLIEYANKIYNYFIQMLEGNLFTPEVIDGIMSRLYILVGIFIFFKLCTLAIRYISEPEQFLDAKVGGEQLIKRILFGSLAIIMMPLIFDAAMKIQTAIISDNVIAKIMLPDNIYVEAMKNKENTGKQVGMMILNGFWGWNSNIDKSQALMEYNSYKMSTLYNDVSYVNDGYITNKVGDDYVYFYVPIISTLAIGYFLLTLVKYAMEVALRMIKLAFLQIIAPFSIIRWMLNPADNDSLKKWTNVTISTYILIFVRVFTLWFIVMMAYYLKNGIPSSNGTVTSLLTSNTDELLRSLIVIGMFAFLKELPKLISDLFGYNLQENEAITGVLNQATGVIKGLALGKVGMEVQKPMMYAGMAAHGFSAISKGVNAYSAALQSTNNKGAAWSNAVGAFGVYGTGQASSMIAGVVSSNFSSTQIAPLMKGTGSVVQTQYEPDFLHNSYNIKNGDNNIVQKVKNTADIQKNNNGHININDQNSFNNFVQAIQEELPDAHDYNDVKTAIDNAISRLGINMGDINNRGIKQIFDHVSRQLRGRQDGLQTGGSGDGGGLQPPPQPPQPPSPPDDGTF